ncbi:hypothetical protein [Halorarius halobius]|uniref:hypothetical protein n=1 Tax=Halorarius halobius TaxID=2962671 RepID=UPI0020CFD89E|nr:hypothetical protein [Halorarius halobius]
MHQTRTHGIISINIRFGEILLVIQNRDGGDTLEAFLRAPGGVFNLLLAYEASPNEPADAEKIIKRLLTSGWLYEVDSELRITDPAT